MKLYNQIKDYLYYHPEQFAIAVIIGASALIGVGSKRGQQYFDSLPRICVEGKVLSAEDKTDASLYDQIVSIEGQKSRIRLHFHGGSVPTKDLTKAKQGSNIALKVVDVGMDELAAVEQVQSCSLDSKVTK